MATKDWKETNYGWKNKKNKDIAISISHWFKNLYAVQVLKYNGVYSEQIKKKETKNYNQAKSWVNQYMRSH